MKKAKQELTAEQISAVMAAMGKEGGYARAERMTAAERREAASKAARARWKDHKKAKP